MTDEQQIKNNLFAQLAKVDTFRAKAHEQGEPALQRLVVIAQQGTDQSLIVQKFLLGCYNGCYRFDLTDFRGLDLSIFQDCMSVLAMDWGLKKEVHEYIPNGSKLFQSWAEKVF
jgi:hypothetical protein